jgi:uncharacterized membrane-anchored protein
MFAKLNWTLIKTLAVIVIILQLATLAIFIGSEYVITSQDRTVLLKIEPVDPNDVFKGDYVILNYDISTIQNYGYDSENNSNNDVIEVGSQVFVEVQNYGDGLYYKSGNNSISWEKSLVDAQSVQIKGRITNVRNTVDRIFESETLFESSESELFEAEPIVDEPGAQKTYSIEYGIEQYYVEQGKGREIEAAIREYPDNAFAVTKVDKNGNIRVVGLEINDVKY